MSAYVTHSEDTARGQPITLHWAYMRREGEDEIRDRELNTHSDSSGRVACAYLGVVCEYKVRS